MASHIAPTGRNHGGMNFDAQLASSFFSSLGPQPMGWCLPTLRMGLPSVKPVWKLPQACPEACLLSGSRPHQVDNINCLVSKCLEEPGGHLLLVGQHSRPGKAAGTHMAAGI